MCLRFALRTCTLVFQTRYSKWMNSSNSWALVLSKHIAAKTHWRAGNSGNSHVRGEEKEQKRISDFYSVLLRSERERSEIQAAVTTTGRSHGRHYLRFFYCYPPELWIPPKRVTSSRWSRIERKPKLNVTRISHCDVMALSRWHFSWFIKLS